MAGNAKNRGHAAVADSIAASVRQRMINKQSAAASVFEARWTMNALLQAAPDLYEALTDQIDMFHESLVTDDDDEITKQGDAACRGWAAAIMAMEKSGIANDAIHIGQFGDTIVAIGRQQTAPEYLREEYGPELVWLTPRECAMLYMRLDVATALKAEWPDAELIAVRERDPRELRAGYMAQEAEVAE